MRSSASARDRTRSGSLRRVQRRLRQRGVPQRCSGAPGCSVRRSYLWDIRSSKYFRARWVRQTTPLRLQKKCLGFPAYSLRLAKGLTGLPGVGDRYWRLNAPCPGTNRGVAATIGMEDRKGVRRTRLALDGDEHAASFRKGVEN